MHQKGDVQFYLLNPEQYLCVYEASSMNSYRADHNNYKDIDKIDFRKYKS